ncbi:hypothetical protein P2R64_32325 [Priestia megaterium]|uniref:hypothetical protein n=1 Tax=Priestia megaterium TaxID=1404 RepID=UPI0023DC8075|nr:hypothetical protein [Priestia megaterium]MDF1964690.1 hypothetical protein [Priestia megaterium]
MAITWTTGITIIGSCGAAVLGQMAANLFTNKRENKKYDKECFQNFYSPLVFKVIEYVYNESFKTSEMENESFNEIDFEKSLLNPEPIFEEIIKYMGDNLKYANPELIMIYEEVKAMASLIQRDKEDPSSNVEYRLSLCREFLLEYIKLSDGLNVLSSTVKDRVKVPLFFTEFYFLLNHCNLQRLAERSLHDIVLFELIILHKDHKDFLDRVIAIEKEITFVTKNRAYQNRYEDAFTDALHFINEVIAAISSIPVAEEVAIYWRGMLEKELENKNSLKISG